MHKTQQAIKATVQILNRAIAYILGRKTAVKRRTEIVQGLPVGNLGAAIDTLAQFLQQTFLHCVPDHVRYFRSL